MNSTPSKAVADSTRVEEVASRGAGSRLRLLGPALLVSVGYVDPGNWATDLEGGSRFGHRLLWVLVASSAIAVLLQAQSARLGIASGKNLAEACRAAYSRRVNVSLWVLAEIGIVACDSAEVVGSAIALNLLFRVPLLVGTFLTTLDVLVVLALQRKRLAVLELLIGGLLAVVAVCLSAELWFARPSAQEFVRGLVPSLPAGAIATAVGIVGATIMPHNLYLQSALVDEWREWSPRTALRRSVMSTAIALNAALVLNAGILLLAAEAFGRHQIVVTDLRDAHRLLAPLLGSTLAAVLFAVGLLCSGQSATVTGTLAGQVVMEGFLGTRLSPIMRRALTRCAAILPAVIVIVSVGERGVSELLVGSQVVLSLQLPFAVVPLLRLTASKRLMKGMVSSVGVRRLAAAGALAIFAANSLLAWDIFAELSARNGLLGEAFAVLGGVGVVFLGWISLTPLRIPAETARESGAVAEEVRPVWVAPSSSR